MVDGISPGYALSMDPLFWLAPCVLIAATIGGVVGFGTGVLMLPLLGAAFGLREAVPMLGIAMLFANASRAGFSWREIDWRVVGAQSLGAVPLALIGASVFAGVQAEHLGALVGGALLVMLPLRRVAEARSVRIRLRHLPFVGAVSGMLSAIGGATGPISTPFLLNMGLVRGAYLGTDGFSSLLAGLSKTGGYAREGLLPTHALLYGGALGLFMMGGSFLGRRLVDHLSGERFTKIVEAAVLAIALFLIVSSFV